MSDTIDCEQNCPIPDGYKLTPVPVPRHAWSDCIVCPNEGCGRAFLVTELAQSARGGGQ